MKYNIFISYAVSEQDIVENFRDRFNKLGVNAWVYSRDRTLAENIWAEIEGKIKESDLVLFVVSKGTLNSKGQREELDLALTKVKSCSSSEMLMPIFIEDTSPYDCPDILKHKNGAFLNAHNVKAVAQEITQRMFPSLLSNNDILSWKFPVPGEWLEVSSLDNLLEAYFDTGDVLYFRALSPMGLFECYSPKTKRLFWISPRHVKPYRDRENEADLEKKIPPEYTAHGMIEILRLGWEAWHRDRKMQE
tara:strand:- start:1330 stop:2073 length:744 start_codon:yes stop_codon:yes gene_type:complete